MSPAMCREFFRPRHAAMWKGAKEPEKARSPLLTTFPFHPVFAVQDTHPADPIFMLCRALQALQL